MADSGPKPSLPNQLRMRWTKVDGTLFWTRLLRASRRWAVVLTVAIIGAIEFHLILPWSWGLWDDAWDRQLFPYRPVFVEIVIAVATVVLVFALAEPIRIRSRQWSRLLWYPPTWVAIGLAWAAAALLERQPALVVTDAISWQHPFPVLPTAGLMLTALFLRQWPWRWYRTPSLEVMKAADQIDWNAIQQWMAAREHQPSHDFFDHRFIVQRITAAIAQGQSVALLGPVGSGKSTILASVRASLERLAPVHIVAPFDVWAIPRPEDAPRMALNRLVSALDAYVDTIEFRSLPVMYQRLAAAEPTGRLSKALGFESASDAVTEVERLTPILEALNARLVLFVEDAERAGRRFEVRHLERLLWALRGVPRCSFVLAADAKGARLAFTKLCDTIEQVPSLDFGRVLRILLEAHRHWKTQYTFIDPHPTPDKADKLELRQWSVGGTMDYIRRAGQDTPPDALITVLQTPRALKHVVRRVERVWANLHGEVDLDDVIIVAALRHGAEEAYKFILANIDAARRDRKDTLPRTKTVKEDWEKLLAKLENADAVQRLVDLLGITQLTKGTTFNTTDSPQGVHVIEPVDYFRRIDAEQLAEDELPDQVVLEHIHDWKRRHVS